MDALNYVRLMTVIVPVRKIGSQERRSVAYHFSQMVAPEDIVACVLNPRYLLIDLRGSYHRGWARDDGAPQPYTV